MARFLGRSCGMGSSIEVTGWWWETAPSLGAGGDGEQRQVLLWIAMCKLVRGWGE